MKNKDFSILKELLSLLKRRQKINFAVIIVILAITAVLSQLTPIMIGRLTDDVLNAKGLSFFAIAPYLLIILIVNIANEVLKVIRRLAVEDTATRTEKVARYKATESLLSAPLSYFREHMSGNIHGRLNRSMEGTVKLIKLIFMDFAPAVASGIAAIVVIFTRLPLSIAFVTILVIPFGVIIVLRQISTQKGIRVELMESKGDMDGTVVELLGGIETIRSVNSIDYEKSRIDDRSESLRLKEMKHHKAMAFYDCLKFLNEAIFNVIVIAVSVWLASAGVISVGAILTTYLCFTQLTGPLRELHRILDEFSESMVLATDYFSLIHIPKDFSFETKERENLPEIESGEINISGLNFSYPEKPADTIINGLNLHIMPGQFVGVAGASGCGKSSLIKVLDKLEKADGRVKIGGIDLTDITRGQLAKKVFYVPQTPFIFAGSIYHNICYGLEDVSLEEVKLAAKRANIYDMIESLDEKYDFILSEAGKNISGGQRQRIAIARIFLRKPQILILDEATSALDNTSESLIQNEIEKLKEENGTTIISIAHRISTLKNCDKIIVMDKGSIIKSGTYDEVFKS